MKVGLNQTVIREALDNSMESMKTKGLTNSVTEDSGENSRAQITPCQESQEGRQKCGKIKDQNQQQTNQPEVSLNRDS